MIRADFYTDLDPMLNIERVEFSTPLTNCSYDIYVVKCSGPPPVGEEWGRQGEGRGQEAAGATPSQGEGEIQGEIDPLSPHVIGPFRLFISYQSSCHVLPQSFLASMLCTSPRTYCIIIHRYIL